MQTDDVEFDITTPNIADSSTLMTPNIDLSAPRNKSLFHTINSNSSITNENSSTSNPSSIATITTSSDPPSIVSSADVKLSIIENELKQSFTETRLPTPSPFQKISTNMGFIEKSIPAMTNDDETTTEIPSTADVVKDLEALTNPNSQQFSTRTLNNNNNNSEREIATNNGDNSRYDSSPTLNMGVIVSPKKKFLIRSQSHTEPTSPIQNNNNNLSQSQKSTNDNNNLSTQVCVDDDSSMDESVNSSFSRALDLPTISNSNDTNFNNIQFKSAIDNGNEQQLNLQIRTDQNGLSQSTIKQQSTISSNTNKRTYQSAAIGNNISPITKANTIIIPQASFNEVTSTDQLLTLKRPRTASMGINTTTSTNLRSSFLSVTVTNTATTTAAATTTNGPNANPLSEDVRKKQIRDSNREAARRCRERRRQYIEQLEGNLEQYKLQIKQLSEKLARVERENTQLRAIISETKILHPSVRLSTNESHVDYGNVVTATNVDYNSDSNNQTDSVTIQRNFRNNH